jgi:serine phosphatase RsbU (regulator of sigma subunit)
LLQGATVYFGCASAKWGDSMTDNSDAEGISLEIASPDGSRRQIKITEQKFNIGRGELDNHLAIPDDRLSRQCAAIVLEDGCRVLEDRGNRRGVFVNGEKITRRALSDGDLITFGLQNSFELTFRSSERDSASLGKWLSNVETVSDNEVSSGLNKLNLLLEATKLLHSQLPLEAVLNAMLDRAIAITHADRGLLMEADKSGSLRNRLARRADDASILVQTFLPSHTALNLALKQQSAVITQDLLQEEGALQGAKSIVAQQLRVVVAIPLYATERAETQASIVEGKHGGQLLGVLYLDSKRPAAFSTLDRQILDAIAIESASILDNARLVQLEQERQRVEQELNIARNIQQALLPRGPRDFPFLKIRGMNSPCHAVGGDYFDILPIDSRSAAFVIADVSGKGLGAALLTTMLQGVFTGLAIGGNASRAFTHINSFLCDRVELGRHATVFFATLDGEGNLEYLNAGHPSPLLLRRGEVSELFTKGSLPLGLIPEVHHPVARTKLEPGDTLILFSDGITEAEDAAGNFFGDERLRQILEGQKEQSLEKLEQSIVGAVRNFVRGASQMDDITLLLAQYAS